MTSIEYVILKQEIGSSVARCERRLYLIDILKELFRDKINSPRRYESITTISQLLKVLEIRDVLSEDDVGVLKLIAQKLPNKMDLLYKIDLYEDNHRVYSDNIDLNASRDQNTTQFSSNISMNQTKSSNISNRKLSRIKTTIINEIGSFRRDLARNLGIREIDIIDIEYYGKTDQEKAKMILDKYDTISDPEGDQRWFVDLYEALELTRRKDLCKSIQIIMSMNI